MDYIDRKLEQEKLKKSVVKYWNVNYSVEQKKIETRTPQKSLKAEAGKTESEGKSERNENYNPYTHSHSGDYGKQPVEADQVEVIDSILEENKFDLDKILEDTDVQNRVEIQQDAGAKPEEGASNPTEEEDLAAQALKRVQSTDATAKAAAAVEEAMAGMDHSQDVQK